MNVLNLKKVAELKTPAGIFRIFHCTTDDFPFAVYQGGDRINAFEKLSLAVTKMADVAAYALQSRGL